MQTDHDLPPPRPRKLRRFLIGVAVVLGLLVLGYLWAAYRPTGYARERRAVEARVAAARPPEVRRPGERTVEPSGAVPSDPWQEVRAAFEKLPEPGRQYLQEAALGGRHFTAWSVQPEESAGAGGIAVGGRVYTRESVVAGILRSAAHLLDRWPAAGGEAEQAFAGMVLGTMREHGPPPLPNDAGMMELRYRPRYWQATELSHHAAPAIAALHGRALGNIGESDRMLLEAARLAMVHHRGFGGGDGDGGRQPARELLRLIARANEIAPVDPPTLDALDAIVAEEEAEAGSFDDIRRQDVLRWAGHLKSNVMRLDVDNSPWLYFLDSVPHNLLRKAAVPVLRRRIEDLALAVADQDAEAIERTGRDVQKALQVMNIRRSVGDLMDATNVGWPENAAVRAALPHAPSRADQYNIPLWEMRGLLAALRHRHATGSWPHGAEEALPPAEARRQRIGGMWNWAIVETGPFNYFDSNGFHANREFNQAVGVFFTAHGRYPATIAELDPEGSNPALAEAFRTIVHPHPGMTLMVVLTARSEFSYYNEKGEGVHVALHRPSIDEAMLRQALEPRWTQHPVVHCYALREHDGPAEGSRVNGIP